VSAIISAAVAVIAVVAGCAGSGSPTGTGHAAPHSAHAARTANHRVCAASSAPGTTELRPSIDGRTRVVRVHTPPHPHATRMPLVLNLHGSGSTAIGQEAFSGMDATADADGFVVAYPQAAIPDGRGDDWNVPGALLVGGRKVPAGATNDVRFVTSLVSYLERSYCIDAARVYATGFSGGARLASQLVCNTSAVFAAIAPVSGLRYPTPCATPMAVPVLSFHGTADPVDPYNGHGQPYWTYSVADAARAWARHDGCGPGRAVAHGGLAYGSCRAGAQVVLYTIPGEGHEWPGGPRMARRLVAALGPQSNLIDADTTMWAFFSHYSLGRS